VDSAQDQEDLAVSQVVAVAASVVVERVARGNIFVKS
jgi:hypothetical protein